MLNWKTTQGSKVHLLKIGITNCFLIVKNRTIFLVDTGQKRFSKKLETQLAILLNHSPLDYLILTHTHYDHAENASMIKKIYSPNVIVHKNESLFLKEGYTKLPHGTNIITDIISGLGNQFAHHIGEYDPVESDIEINDSYIFEETPDIKIIHTPGHTLGSISIIIDNEIALVGDTLFGIFKNKILPPFADDKNGLFKSWAKLLNTPCKSFIPAHGKLIKRELLEKKLHKLIN